MKGELYKTKKAALEGLIKQVSLIVVGEDRIAVELTVRDEVQKAKAALKSEDEGAIDAAGMSLRDWKESLEAARA